MADAVGAGGGLGVHGLRQFGDAARFLPQVQRVAEAGNESGTVVAAVLEPAQAVEQDRGRFALAGEAYDSAHGSLPPLPLGERGWG